MRPLYLYDLPSIFATQIRTAEAESSLVLEPMIGLVTDNKDPLKLGRVKVKLPVLSETETTFWSPIIMLGAGKNRGWFFIPEKDDEVLVLFEHGDITRPLIVGAFWNGKDKPPEAQSASNPRRVIKSRQGSKIIFDDDKNSLSIEDGKGIGKITIDAGANKITIEALQGDVCFQAPAGEIQIAGKGAELTAGTNFELHAGSTMAWGSDADVTIDGGGSMTMSGAQGNANCGSAESPSAPSPSPVDVADPYGS